jgi:hypothetical protein
VYKRSWAAAWLWLLSTVAWLGLGGYGVQVTADADDRYALYYTNPDSRGFRTYSRMGFYHELRGVTFLEADLGYPHNAHPASFIGEGPVVRLALIANDGRIYRSPALRSRPYQWEFDTRQVPDGSHYLTAQWSWDGAQRIVVLDVPVTVNNGDVPTGAQAIAVTPWKMREEFGAQREGSAFVWFPGRLPTPRGTPAPVRPAVPYDEVLPLHELWAERMTTAYTVNQLPREFSRHPSGAVTIAPRQLYFLSDHDILRTGRHRDGPRNVGSIGHAVNGYVEPDGSLVTVTANGRIARIDLEGNIETLVGWRNKPGVLNPAWESWKEDRDFFMEGFELVGEFVDGPETLNKPWDVAADPHDPQVLYVSDTGNQRIVRVDTSRYPPEVTTLAGSLTREAGYRDGIGADALFFNPWGIAIGEDRILYVSDGRNSAIRTVELDTGKVETLFKSPVNPPHHDLHPRPAQELRAEILRSGSLDDPHTTMLHPHGLRFDSEGRLIVAQHHVYALGRIDLWRRTIEHFAELHGDHRGGGKEINLAVDRWGVVGPKDDVFVVYWRQNAHERYGADGTRRPNFVAGRSGVGLLRGPMSAMIRTAYPWMVVVGEDASLWHCQTAGEGCWRITRRLPSDPEPDLTLYFRGREVYIQSNGPENPPLAQLHGTEGVDLLGGSGFDALGALSDSELATHIRTEWRRPDLGGEDLAALIYYIKWNSVNSDLFAR